MTWLTETSGAQISQGQTEQENVIIIIIIIIIIITIIIIKNNIIIIIRTFPECFAPEKFQCKIT